MRQHGFRATWRVMVLKWKMMLDKDGRPLRKVIMIESRHLRKLLVLGLFAWVTSVGYVYKSSSDGRRELAANINRINQEQTLSSRGGCQRGKDRAKEVALIIEAVLKAFRDTDSRRLNDLTKLRVDSEETIGEGIDKLIIQSKINCTKAFPNKSKVK